MILRLFLFSGLLLHKGIWEMLKKQGQQVSPGPTSGRPGKERELNIKTLIKGFKSLVLLFLVIQTLFLDIFPISDHPFPFKVVGVVIYVVGLTTAIVGRLQLGRNWANLEDYQVLAEQELVKSGIYGYIRHPIYSGDILLILGLELALNSWLVLIVLPLIFLVVRQTFAEEAILVESFQEYNDYRRRTKMFIPFLI